MQEEEEMSAAGGHISEQKDADVAVGEQQETLKEDKGDLCEDVLGEDDGLEEGRVPIKVSLGRLASGAFQAVSSATSVPQGDRGRRFAALRKFGLPIAIFVFLLVILLLFRAILLPFIMALVIVYLMEPVVGRVSRAPGESGLPRWVAVIFVYVVFLGVITTTVVLITPRFVSEIKRFVETVPMEVRVLHKEKLPAWNKQVKATISQYLPKMSSTEQSHESALDFDPVSVHVHKARIKATSHTSAFAEAKRRLGWATQIKSGWVREGDEPTELKKRYFSYVREDIQKKLSASLWTSYNGSWSYVWDTTRPTFKMVPLKGGGFEFFVERVDLSVEHTEGGAWRVRELHAPKEDLPTKKSMDGPDIYGMFDLEKGLNELMEDMVKSSNQKIAPMLKLLSNLANLVIQSFVGLVLTLMVAAFISIDLHAVMNFFRSLIPKDYRERYDALLHELDRGLSGVVRGQLTICLVNGMFTYIGLIFLDVKFSLLLAVVAGVLSLIPIFGTILSTIPIVLVSLTTGWTTAFLALGWVLLIHFVEANILNPKIIGTSAHIHPVIVIFALLAGESAFGLVGALLAVPTASILLTLFKFFLVRAGLWDEAIEAAEETGRLEGTRPNQVGAQ